MTHTKTFSYEIGPEHVDFQKNISPMTLASNILSAAGNDANERGFGLMDLQRKNCSWVVSRLEMELEKTPTIGDNISIETWVKDVGKIFTNRNFQITNGANNILGYAILSWAILDLENRNSVPLDVIPEINQYVVDKTIPLESLERVPDIEGVRAGGFKVRYSDIDLNVHTNVLKYLQAICDCFSLEFYASRTLKSISINFLRELNFGDKGSVIYKEVEPNNFVFKLVKEDGTIASRSRMVFENNNSI